VSLRLPEEESPGAGLQAVLLSLAREAQCDLEGVRESSEERIHNLRRGMKKYRSLLRLAGGVLKKGAHAAIQERVRILKEGLAGSRDGAVIFQTARDVLGEEAAERLGLSCRHAGGSTSAPEKMMAAATELVARTEALDLQKLDQKRLEKRWRRSLDKMRAAARTAEKSGNADDFHAWRKRTKDLWYQSEALAEFKKRIAKTCEPTERLSDALGSEHDLTLVLESVEQLLPEDREQLEARREQLRVESLEIAKPLLKSKK
jgi:CHAD domain-containing protein